MFNGCNKFDCDLSSWNVSNMTNTSGMFAYCWNWTGKGIENWNVSNVKDMSYMFVNCKKFNCDLSDWDVSNITCWKNMFSGCDKMIIPAWYNG